MSKADSPKRKIKTGAPARNLRPSLRRLIKELGYEAVFDRENSKKPTRSDRIGNKLRESFGTSNLPVEEMAFELANLPLTLYDFTGTDIDRAPTKFIERTLPSSRKIDVEVLRHLLISIDTTDLVTDEFKLMCKLEIGHLADILECNAKDQSQLIAHIMDERDPGLFLTNDYYLHLIGHQTTMLTLTPSDIEKRLWSSDRSVVEVLNQWQVKPGTNSFPKYDGVSVCKYLMQMLCVGLKERLRDCPEYIKRPGRKLDADIANTLNSVFEIRYGRSFRFSPDLVKGWCRDVSQVKIATAKRIEPLIRDLPGYGPILESALLKQH